MMRLNRRRGQKGFTLIELLIVIAIIGIIAAILIPNLLDALQKAKQKRTVADMRNVGTAWFAWLTDMLSAAAAGADNTYDFSDFDTVEASGMVSTLVPRYIQKIPSADGWGGDYNYYRHSDLLNDRVMAIQSGGRGGATDGTSYTIGPFAPTDYAQDIVWADGFFIHYPQGAGGLAAAPAQ